MSLVKRFRVWLFSPPERTRYRDLLIWWELRRIPCNLAIALFGLLVVTLICLAEVWSSNRTRVPDFFLLLMILAIIVVCSNFWYTGGWIAHILLALVLRRPLKRFAPVMFISGTVFSFVFILGLLGAFAHDL